MEKKKETAPGRERRKNPRIPLGVKIIAPHLRKTVLSQNLSKTGCFLPVNDWGVPGETLPLLMDLPEIGVIPFQSHIVHKEGGGTGIEFISISPEDMKKYHEFLELFGVKKPSKPDT